MDQKRQAIIITDLGFGDAGKGTITDFLARRCAAHTVVRYNGGPQAAHNVVCADGKHHTFSQFASGTFLPGTKTLLSRFMLVNPLNMLKEERHLRACSISDALQRMQIDRRAMVITPFQRAINRLKEIARAANRHGSCGEGIGECMADYLKYGNAVLFATDLEDHATLLKKLHFLRAIKRDEFEELRHALPQTESVQQECALFTTPGCIEDCSEVYRHFSGCVEMVDETAIRALFAQPGTILFEGAQGVLLDENYGFAPYTTWSTTTCANAETLLQENDYTGKVIKLGVMRTYATRHGAGPFPTEDRALTRILPEPHNTWNDWQQTFRLGHCDLVATRYARDVVGQLDYLALTHIDQLESMPAWRICTAYHYQGDQQDLDTYFKHTEEKLPAIKIHHPLDLAHQEKLTSRLWSCTPEYQTFSAEPGLRLTQEDRTKHFSLIEERLNVPIGISSYGPTAREKMCSQAFASCLRN
jgi:adenylosuccinate synthase